MSKKEDSKSTKYICNYCGYNAKGRADNFKRHLKGKCSNTAKKIEIELDNKIESKVKKEVEKQVKKEVKKRIKKKNMSIEEMDLSAISNPNMDNILSGSSSSETEDIVEEVKAPIKQRKSNKIIFELSKKQLDDYNKEGSFKVQFKNKLKQWHNELSGGGISGDPALDDIIHLLMVCYFINKASDTGKYDFFNKDKYNSKVKPIISKYFECLTFKFIDDNRDNLTKSKNENDGKCVFEKIGKLLSNHELTKDFIKDENFINCEKDNVLYNLFIDINKYTKKNNIFDYQDLIGIAYEAWANDYKGNTGKELGNYFTERLLMLMCFTLIDKEDIIKFKIDKNSIIGDEFCGTFGFPLYLKKYLEDTFKIKIKSRNIYGIELEPRLSKYAIINAMFALDKYNEDYIKKGDSFTTHVKPHLDISVHNVPFGKRMKFKNIKEQYNSYRVSHPEIPAYKEILPIELNNDVVLASQMVIYKTTKIGLCIIKDGQETSGTGKFINYRKHFCDTCNIKKIMKIPGGIFSSTGTKTVCIYFTKEKPTENIQFLELNEECNKITEICNVSIAELKENKYSWNPNNYILDEYMAKIMATSICEWKKLKDISNMLPTTKHYTKIGKLSGPYRFYNSSQNDKFYLNNAEINKESIIIGNGGDLCVHYDIHFTASKHVTVIHINENILTKYIYYFILYNIETIKTKATGGAIQWLNKDKINNIKIPIPTLEYQNDCVENLDDLSNQKQILTDRKEGIIKQMKIYLQIQLKINKNNIITKNFGDICEINNGKNITKTNIKQGNIPVVGGGVKPLGYHNISNLKSNTIIISKDGANAGFVSKYKIPIFATGHALYICNINNIINKEYLYYILKFLENKIYKLQKGGAQPGINKEEVKNNIKIDIPQLEKQKEIVTYLDALELEKNNIDSKIETINTLMKDVLKCSYT